MDGNSKTEFGNSKTESGNSKTEFGNSKTEFGCGKKLTVFNFPVVWKFKYHI